MNLLRVITPLNIQSEKEKFFKSIKYNPIFKYIWETEKIKVKNIGGKKHSFVQSILKQDHSLIVNSSSILFRTNIDDITLLQAEEVIKNKPKCLKNPDLKQVVHSFEDSLKYFNIDYKVEVTDNPGFNFRPNHFSKSIVISKEVNLENFSLEGALLHEMTHIVRAENNKHNNIKRYVSYLPTEEGMASYLQDYKTKGENYSLFQHAAEYSATKVGVNGSLRDIYDYFLSIGFSKELSWQRAIRHKFGFIDTGKPGDILKPAMYFYNEQHVKKLSAKQILKLFVGKISIDKLKYYPKYIGKIHQDKIIGFFNLY